MDVKIAFLSSNRYMNAMPTRKNYLMLQETSLSVVIAMHHFPTRFNSIIIKLSEVVIKPWMNKVLNLR
jgi:hypothetical protein